MTSGYWFNSLEVAHRLSGRVRLRYRCYPGTPTTASAIECAIGNLAGVTAVRVNPGARSVVIHFREDETGLEQLLAHAAALLPPATARGVAGLGPALSVRPVVSSLGTLLGTRHLPPSMQLPASLGAATPLLRHALDDYAENGVSSHVLEALAVSISLARQEYTAANTTTFMLALGEYLEDSIARRSDDLLKHLLRPASDEVWVLRDGQETLIPVAELAVGETVVVGSGAVVPADGTVLGGEATVNQAAMTGESVAVSKVRGDKVLSGTVVEEGRLSVYAEQVGRNTAAARIADYVAHSLVAKGQVQLEACRLADRLVPLVLGLASGAYLLSGNLGRAASVLQADYSCALKLATPVAFKSAMYGAGRAGILIKGATALERLAEADTFIFDKTGTLTAGRLAVTDSIAFDGAYSAEDVICLAASVEEHYFHPLALAVVAAARATHGHHFDHQEVKFIVAHGVASVIDGKRIVVGSRHFIEDDEKIEVGPHAEAVVDRLYREGKTLLYIGYGGALLGVIALRDELRANSEATIRKLRALGVRRILLLTGDHRDRAEEMASRLGLDAVHAELLPQDKAQIVEELSATGARIAFVGDGINDAPALAGAHVGIAMQKGADIARLTADVALLEDDIECVAEAKEIAMSAMSRIGTNYRLTVGLNTSILAAAALGLLSPIATALLHNGSTIAILLNALRRKRKRAK